MFVACVRVHVCGQARALKSSGSGKEGARLTAFKLNQRNDLKCLKYINFVIVHDHTSESD